MTWITASDPLALLAAQAGVATPAEERGSANGGSLDTNQRAVQLGEPVPVVFARRRGEAGGVLVSPGATEARFENDTDNRVTAFYHLVISEGQIDKIQVRDVFQRNCRRGSFTQTYNRRAGTWDPGNVIVQRSGKELPQCPQYCGTVGVYPGMSTLSFQVQAEDGSTEWDRQVHLFIRGGLNVTRLFDNVTGPSDNFCDLIRWALAQTGRVPESLIDLPAMQSAASFLERRQFWCNTWIQQSRNLLDLVAEWAPFFLLRETSIAGRRGFRPVLPTTAQGDFITTAITPAYTFDDSLILPDTFEISYTSLADRQPFTCQVMWRQQLEGDVGIIRTSEIRYESSPAGGPYESHDLSAFCTTEEHAIRVGAYILSKRCRTQHTIRFTARPEAHSKLLSQGDIVKVKVRRKVANAGVTFHEWLYQVERITKTLAGDVSYECSHFPIDAQGRSLIALDVMAVAPTGIILPPNRTGPSCDVNSASDTSVPAESGRTGFAISSLSLPGSPGGGSPGGSDAPNPEDNLDKPPIPLTVYPGGPPGPGKALVLPEDPCGNGQIPEWRWLKGNEPWNGQNQRYVVIGTAQIQGGNGPQLRGEWRCPNGEWTPSDTVEPDPSLPAGTEMQLFWSANYVAYGFYDSGWLGWRDASQILEILFTGDEYTSFDGQPSRVGDVGYFDGNGMFVKVASNIIFRLNQKMLWVTASRTRTNNGPWENIQDYQSLESP